MREVALTGPGGCIKIHWITARLPTGPTWWAIRRRVDVIGAEEALFRLHYLVEQHTGTIKGNFPF